MRLSNRALIVTVVLVLLLVAAACSSNQPEAPVADEQIANTPVSPAEPTPALAAEATQPSAPEAPAASAPEISANPILFAVDPAQSEARFVIDEQLMGSPKTVVGTNSGVGGQVTVNPGDPGNLEIGPIVIDATQFVTDSNQRNNAIRRFILQSSSYPTITFTPTAIEGVPAAVSIGDNLSLQVTGDLTIREITHAETFAITVQVVSTSELRINGSTQILRENYELTIPSVSSVANVTNEVQLQFDFVATAQ